MFYGLKINVAGYYIQEMPLYIYCCKQYLQMSIGHKNLL